jgi:hypothetical protein
MRYGFYRFGRRDQSAAPRACSPAALASASLQLLRQRATEQSRVRRIPRHSKIEVIATDGAFDCLSPPLRPEPYSVNHKIALQLGALT